MQIGRLDEKGWTAVLALALVTGLGGCSPLRTGYVVNPGAGEPLELRSPCDGERFTSVLVRYVVDGDPEAYFAQTPVWSVEFPESSGAEVVLLFEDNPGGTAELGQVDIDWDRDMVVLWETESGAGTGRGVGGDLGDLAPGNVIWQSGGHELDVFEQKAPKRGFGRQPPN
jgi:hypothetical protein